MKSRLLYGFIYLSICINYGSNPRMLSWLILTVKQPEVKRCLRTWQRMAGVKLRSPIMLLIFYIIFYYLYLLINYIRG